MSHRLTRVLLVFVLLFSFLLTGCTTKKNSSTTTTTVEQTETTLPEFSGLDDQDLLDYIEDNVYANVIESLNSDEYYVENVRTAFVSKEYLDELEFNSKENIYFGYNLKTLEEQFQGTKFVFVPDEKTQKTVVKEFENYDDTFEVAVKDMAVGTGVILTLVTVSAISGATGNYPLCILFASYAKDAATMAIGCGTFGGVVAGIEEGVNSNDFEKALKASVAEGSKEFKWAAICAPVLSTTETVLYAKGLLGQPLNGLTYKEAVAVQKASRYPTSIISRMQNIKEYRVYKKLGLKARRLEKGQWYLGPRVNLDKPFQVTSKGKTITTTNRERIKKGLSPIDIKTGDIIEIHHIGQKLDSPFALINAKDHDRFSSILHSNGKQGVHSQLSNSEWTSIRQQFWKDYLTKYGGK